MSFYQNIICVWQLITFPRFPAEHNNLVPSMTAKGNTGSRVETVSM